MRPRFDAGRIHDGFYAALFLSDSEAGSLYAQIIATLMQVDGKRQLPIFLSGIKQTTSWFQPFHKGSPRLMN